MHDKSERNIFDCFHNFYETLLAFDSHRNYNYNYTFLARKIGSELNTDLLYKVYRSNKNVTLTLQNVHKTVNNSRNILLP